MAAVRIFTVWNTRAFQSTELIQQSLKIRRFIITVKVVKVASLQKVKG